MKKKLMSFGRWAASAVLLSTPILGHADTIETDLDASNGIFNYQILGRSNGVAMEIHTALKNGGAVSGIHMGSRELYFAGAESEEIEAEINILKDHQYQVSFRFFRVSQNPARLSDDGSVLTVTGKAAQALFELMKEAGFETRSFTTLTTVRGKFTQCTKSRLPQNSTSCRITLN